MARIPTILSESGLQGNYNPGFASPSAFANDSMGQLSNALGQVAGASVNIGNSIQRNRDRDARNTLKKVQHQGEMAEFWKRDKLERENERWSADKLRVLKEYSDFKSSEEFAGIDGKAQAAFDWLQKSRQNFGKDFSKETASKIGGWFDSITASEYERLSGVDADERLERNVTQVNNFISAASDSDPVDSVYATRAGIEFVNDTFNEQPAIKSSYLGSLIENQIAIDPAIGQEILNETKGIDAGTRKSLQDRISRIQEDSLRSERQLVLEKSQADYNTAVRDGVPYEPESAEYLVGLFGKVDGERIYRDQFRRAAVHNTALDLFDSYDDMNPAIGLMQASTDLEQVSGLDDNMRSEVRASLKSKFDALADEFENDTPAWIDRHDDVAAAKRRAIMSGRDSDWFNYLRLQMMYQGEAPDGASQEERARYAFKPAAEHSILSKKAAKEHVKQIRGGDIRSAVDYTRNLFQRYPEFAHGMIISDLADPAKGGLGPMYGAILPLVNEDGFETALQYLRNAPDSASKVSDEMSEAINDNAKYQAFRAAMMQRGGGSARMVEEGYDAVIPAIVSGMPANLPVEDRVNSAVEFLTRQVYPITINGNPTLISRDYMPGGSEERITDEIFLQDHGRRLEYAITQIPAAELNPRQFGPLETPEQIQAAYSHINNTGNWYPSADGKSMILYMKAMNGITEAMVPALTKDGNEIRLFLDELPDFTKMISYRDQLSGSTVNREVPLRKTSDPQLFETGSVYGLPLLGLRKNGQLSGRGILEGTGLSALIPGDAVESALGNVSFDVPFFGEKIMRSKYPGMKMPDYISK